MHVFLSYSHADRGLAARLRRSLEAKGLIFNDPSEGPDNGTSWGQRVEEAIRSAEAILLLLGPRKKIDEPQQRTWMLALQAVWKDPAKHWLPILVRDAKLPAFVRSGAAGNDVQAIRIRDSKDLGPAIEAILQTLGVISRDDQPRRERPREVLSTRNGNGEAGRREASFKISSPRAGGARAGRLLSSEVDRFLLSDVIETYPVVTAEDRVQWQEHLSQMRKYVEQLKH
jgi:hypothetical protein